MRMSTQYDDREHRRWTATDMMEHILSKAFGHPTVSYAEPELSEPQAQEPKCEDKQGMTGRGRAKL